jgi:adenylate kinase
LDDALTPEYVVSLECGDEYLKNRVMSLPESQLQALALDKECKPQCHIHSLAFAKKMEAFKAQNTDDLTVLNFFDDNEIHPLVFAVDTYSSVEKLTKDIISKIGKPRNYGLSMAQIEALKKQEEEKKRQEEEKKLQEKNKNDKEEEERQKKAMAEWVCL